MKQSIEQLAIFGGPPLFRDPHLVGRPNALNRERFLDRINCVLDSGMLTNGGQMVAEFERRLAQELGVNHAVAVCNGTMALQIMARACGLTGEVIVPSMTFIATAHALEWIGLTPVFADIDPTTHTLDPQSIERCIGPKTSAILGVHLWGNVCDLAALRKLANQHQLQLLYDASHAFGSSREGFGNETFGDAEAISFHATKVLQSIEGGAVLTNDDEIADRARLQRNFGITGLTAVDSVGTNGKMNEICAAAGLTSLEQSPAILKHNNQILASYREELNNIPGLSVANPESRRQINAQYVVVNVDRNSFGLTRDQLLEVLRADGIFARSYFSPGCHLAHPYVGNAVHMRTSLPATELLSTQIMQLPTGTSVSEDDVRKISGLLRFVSANCREVDAALKLRQSVADLQSGQIAANAA